MRPSDWLMIVIGNATLALLLALLAWSLGRSRRYATLSHWLWIAALVKLVAPPLALSAAAANWKGEFA